jgi:starvation-inducible DNA-binding protein
MAGRSNGVGQQSRASRGPWRKGGLGRGLNAMAEESEMTSAKDLKARQAASLATPSGLGANATKDIGAALNALLADMFALYLKTKNFHWHVSGPHFRDYHLLLDEQGSQIFATTDDIAERVRKIGGTTLRSIGHVARLQRLTDNDAEYVTPQDMLAELKEDNQQLIQHLRSTHGVCDEHGDVATASLIETWIDEAERRVWFLFEAGRRGEA